MILEANIILATKTYIDAGGRGAAVGMAAQGICSGAFLVPDTDPLYYARSYCDNIARTGKGKWRIATDESCFT